MSRNYAWGSDMEARRNLAPLPTGKKQWAKCAYCDEPFTDPATTWLEMNDADGGYPRSWFTLRLCLAHSGCGPERGYNIQLSRLLKGLGPIAPYDHGWINHLREKEWWAPTYENELWAAYDLAQQLGRRKERAASRPKPNPRAISARTRASVLERDGFRCRRCGARSNEARLVLDHITPVARGGSGDASNLQTLCHDCNAGKAAREPHPHDMGDQP